MGYQQLTILDKMECTMCWSLIYLVLALKIYSTCVLVDLVSRQLPCWHGAWYVVDLMMDRRQAE